MLYVVGTPIGNLGDLSLRAVETLKSVDFVIAENPGHTTKLLSHYKIPKKELLQFAEHNETRILPKLLEKLKIQDAALVTDAGTPGISDPGFRLVRACVQNGIAVTPIPGANAGITALCASGLPTDKFLFVGFLQKTEPKVLASLKEAEATAATLVAYESPQRILKTLRLVAKHFPNSQVTVARELTKIHEEFIRGTAVEIAEQLSLRQSVKGEIVLLVSFKQF